MELYIIRHAQSTNNVLTDQSIRVCDPPLTELGERQAQFLAEHLSAGWQPITWTPNPTPPGVLVDGTMRSYGLTHLYCSPMLRSMQTAQPIAEATGLTPEIWIDIHEQGGMFLEEGDGEARIAVGKPGMTRVEIMARFPSYMLPNDITEQGWYNAGYEEWMTCHVRAARVAAAFRAWKGDRDARVGIISHGGFADALLKALLHGGPAYKNGSGNNGNGNGAGQRPGFFYLHFNTAIDRIDFVNQGAVGVEDAEAIESHLRVAYLNRVQHLPPDA